MLTKQMNFSENQQNAMSVNSLDKLENRIHIEQQAVKMMESVKAVENRWDVAEKENDLATEQQKEKILQLYKQGMNILEISKELKIGQGEVKLIIGLYTT